VAEDWRPTRFANGLTPAEKLALAPELERLMADPAWPVLVDLWTALIQRVRAAGFDEPERIQYHIGFVDGIRNARATSQDIVQEAEVLLKGTQVRAAAARERGFESGGDLSF
jgi:hypothetical protein